MNLIAGFATDPNLLAMQNRALWITGRLTRLAHRQLETDEWTVREGSQL